MTKATDKNLGELHGKLAQVMLRSLESSDEAITLLDEFGEDLPVPVLLFLEKASITNPALLQAVSKFLKDNEITCAIADSDELTGLARTLRNKTNRKSVGNVVHLEEDV